VKVLSAVVVTLTALGLPAIAGAKGLMTVRVCGAYTCAVLADPTRAARVPSPQESVLEPPRPAPYYRLEISSAANRQPRSYSALYVPSAALLAADVGAARALLWYVPRTEALAELRTATRNVEPFDAPSAWPPAVEVPEVVTVGRSADWPAVAALTAALAAASLMAARIRGRRPTTA
jgi:hypothetical protein